MTEVEWCQHLEAGFPLPDCALLTGEAARKK
jgi:hypothetical protein